MISFYANSYRILPRLNNFVRSFCIKTNNVDGAFDHSVKEIFSPEQHTKVLETLNESTPEDLSKYKISNIKIRDMSEWKKKRGPFKSLSEVLEIEGFGEKLLSDICKNIVSNNISEAGSEATIRPPKIKKHVKQMLVPEMGSHLSTSLQSAVAIHLEPTGIGWAKLGSTSNYLTDWKFENFSSLPAKMLPPDTFKLAVDIVSKTPVGDAYIFEAPQNLSLQGQTKQAIVSTHNQQLELLSMLLAMLNTSTRHNEGLPNPDLNGYHIQPIENRVFYLRSKLAARLFSTLIGYEKVSAISSIAGIVNNNPAIVRSLPCTPVKFDPSLNHNFMNQTSTNKELMAQALMLGVSFMDLCIYRSSNSYEALRPRHHQKKEESSKHSKQNLG